MTLEWSSKAGGNKVRRNKRERERETEREKREERHRCRERARGESQGESHLFASEKLLNSMCDLRERALKSQPKMP